MSYYNDSVIEFVVVLITLRSSTANLVLNFPHRQNVLLNNLKMIKMMNFAILAGGYSFPVFCGTDMKYKMEFQRY